MKSQILILVSIATPIAILLSQMVLATDASETWVSGYDYIKIFDSAENYLYSAADNDNLAWQAAVWGISTGKIEKLVKGEKDSDYSELHATTDNKHSYVYGSGEAAEEEIKREAGKIVEEETVGVKINIFSILFYLILLLIGIWFAFLLLLKKIRKRILKNLQQNKMKFKYAALFSIAAFILTIIHTMSFYDYFNPISFIFLGGVIIPAYLAYAILKEKKWVSKIIIPFFSIWILVTLLFLDRQEYQYIYILLLILNPSVIIFTILWKKSDTRNKHEK